LLHAQAKRKLLATSDPSTRKLGLLNLVNGGRNAMVPQELAGSTIPVNPPLVVDNEIAAEADPGPFKLARAGKLEAFGPVLVVFLDNGFVDVVPVELSPHNLHHRKNNLHPL
jgi:hypothetical protein